MTASSTLLALFLMPLCLWIYSRPWINTAVVQLLPLGAVSLTLGSTLLPIGLGVLIRYRYPRAADLLVKVGTAPATGRGGVCVCVSYGSDLSGPSEPIVASHRHIPLLRWDIRVYSLEIKRQDRDRRDGKGQVIHPLVPGRQPDPGAEAFPTSYSLPAPPAPRASETNLQARRCFLKHADNFSLIMKGEAKHKPWLYPSPASHPKAE